MARRPVTGSEPLTRREAKRNSPEVKAKRAAVLLDDPNLRLVFDEVRNRCIRDIECTRLDGSEAAERKMLELVRELQAVLEIKRTILQPLVAEAMKSGKRNA